MSHERFIIDNASDITRGLLENIHTFFRNALAISKNHLCYAVIIADDKKYQYGPAAKPQSTKFLFTKNPSGQYEGVWDKNNLEKGFEAAKKAKFVSIEVMSNVFCSMYWQAWFARNDSAELRKLARYAAATKDLHDNFKGAVFGHTGWLETANPNHVSREVTWAIPAFSLLVRTEGGRAFTQSNKDCFATLATHLNSCVLDPLPITIATDTVFSIQGTTRIEARSLPEFSRFQQMVLSLSDYAGATASLEAELLSDNPLSFSAMFLKEVDGQYQSFEVSV